MAISRIIDSMSQYLFEAVMRIFAPSDDAYPAIGVQPFGGEAFNKRQGGDW